MNTALSEILQPVFISNLLLNTVPETFSFSLMFYSQGNLHLFVLSCFTAPIISLLLLQRKNTFNSTLATKFLQSQWNTNRTAPLPQIILIDGQLGACCGWRLKAVNYEIEVTDLSECERVQSEIWPLSVTVFPLYFFPPYFLISHGWPKICFACHKSNMQNKLELCDICLSH